MSNEQPDDGGSYFPIPHAPDEPTPGASVRAVAAIAAMQALISNSDHTLRLPDENCQPDLNFIDGSARMAIAYADALIAKLKEPR